MANDDMDMHPKVWIHYTYRFDDEFQSIKVIRRGRGVVSNDTIIPKPCYTSQIGINAPKKQDLLSLVSSGVIPNKYKGYYEDLPVSKDEWIDCQYIRCMACLVTNIAIPSFGELFESMLWYAHNIYMDHWIQFGYIDVHNEWLVMLDDRTYH